MLTFPVLPAGALATEAGGDGDPATKFGVPKPSYLEPLNADDTTPVLGVTVIGLAGEDFGLVTNVIVDRDGRPCAAVIDFGGFLGIGSRKVAVDWTLLQFDLGEPNHSVVLRLNRHEIQSAPEYKPGAVSTSIVGPPWLGRVTGDAGGE